MHLWRNRQTRQIQVLVGATRCRFDSCQVHQKSAKLKRVLPIFTFSLFIFHSSLKSDFHLSREGGGFLFYQTDVPVHATAIITEKNAIIKE